MGVSPARHPFVAQLRQHPRYEIVPTSTLARQVGQLPDGCTVTITCSPSRSIEGTLATAERLAGRGLRLVPHLAAREVRDDAHVRDIVDRLRRLGVREVFVVGGDGREPQGRFGSAADLIEALLGAGLELDALGVAAYPEGHPSIDDQVLVEALLAKQEHASYMVTQMCFDADVIAGWLQMVRRAGVHLPALVGVPGITDRRKLLEMSVRVGAGASSRYLKKNARFVGRLLTSGRQRTERLVDALVPYAADPAYRIAGLHVFTFNQVNQTEVWRAATIERLESFRAVGES